jgi:hypothetical protein
MRKFGRWLAEDQLTVVLSERQNDRVHDLQEDNSMNKRFSALFVIFSLVLVSRALAPCPAKAKSTDGPPIEKPAAGLININKLAMWTQSDGLMAYNPFTQPDQSQIPWGVIYPYGVPAGVVYGDGLVWGGFVQDGQTPALRVGGSTWLTGLQPGAILPSGLAEDPAADIVNRVWRYRRDWQTADLTPEAYTLLVSRPGAASRHFQYAPAELNAVADSLRAAYAKDKLAWPWQKGAPYYDANHNDIMDENEEPGLLNADQVVWYVANDLDPQRTLALYGSPPIGLEVQVTLWGYDQADLENSIYRRTRIIYKGTQSTPASAVIDSMAIGLYSDIDIGSYDDDLAGTDTTLQMMYGYNSTPLDTVYKTKYSLPPPAVGYSLLYGPIVAGSHADDRACFDFKMRQGFRNLPMTSSWVDRTGDTDSQPTTGKYDGTQQYYNVLSGFRPRPVNPPDPFHNPATGATARFSMTGDPVAGTGWLDDFAGNRQITFSCGHFRMALGDTQEVTIVMTAALGADRLASVTAMKFFTRKAREYAGYMFVTHAAAHALSQLPASLQLLQNYPNPCNSGTVFLFDLPAAAEVRLTVYDLTGRRVRTLVDERRQAGRHSLHWDGTDALGARLPSGHYLIRLESGAVMQTRKMTLMR